MKLQKSKKVIVVGGGASGIIAAIAARRMGAILQISMQMFMITAERIANL
jgi:succinate dehydrogenase/fumarate reductase flavoprotein subunit